MEEDKEHKFNFSEEEKSNQKSQKDQANDQMTNEMNKENFDEKKQAVKKDAHGLWKSFTTFVHELLDFRHDTDRDATITAIKADIPFKGATAWILVCSIMVASVGLNADSPAVVIGAMLISPLMGPILGVGLSIAINDIDTLRRSLVNLATMIVLSLLTAFLFFYFFPLNEDTSELLGRTSPDIRDVLIAFFGGLALIIARTKKGTIASVIFGVAIATALMPPLCTAGYGLAIGNWTYFLGAMNLFTINTIFIALATFIVLKVLGFPMLKYANSAKRRRTARLALLLALVVMVYPTITFVKVLKKKGLESDYQRFIADEIKSNTDLWYQNGTPHWDDETIDLYFNGEVSDQIVTNLKNKIKNYNKIKDFELIIKGNNVRGFDKISDAYDRAIRDLDQKDFIIDGLQKKVGELQANITNLNEQMESKSAGKTAISFTHLSRDAKVRFNDLEYFGYAKMLESKDFINIDTVNVVNLRWKVSLNDSLVVKREKDLQQWLKKELDADTIFIRRN